MKCYNIGFIVLSVLYTSVDPIVLCRALRVCLGCRRHAA